MRPGCDAESVSISNPIRFRSEICPALSKTGTTASPRAGIESGIRPTLEQQGTLTVTFPRRIGRSEWFVKANSWRIVWSRAKTEPRSNSRGSGSAGRASTAPSPRIAVKSGSGSVGEHPATIIRRA